ncbi:regulator of RNase E activity RraA [Aliiruegeria haliotis]|uniref:Putative 4-hydroxy-4-methyl-2-oxoglutarate aldolase n=1 Tax=Aliiruegeria haliotis TaxID=1280846 RepID=A0A2T0RDV8_9RHOB|nr:RraA family protein [Aliiruegeria haliotis]PRY19345.1 regulator of RNase E activity RraA [Aliiruegeria haliotis]
MTSNTSLQKEAEMMELEKLIRAHEELEQVDLGIPDEEVLERFGKIYTGAISDVLREHVLLDQALPPELMPLRDGQKMVGFAFTVKSASNTRVTGELTYRTEMLDEMTPNSIVMWDTTGDMDSTAWGGVMTANAVGRGVVGAVIDGGIRDIDQIREKAFPIFYRYRSPNGSLGRCLISHFQTMIRIGRTEIRPGDIIVGDADGVIVVPRKIAISVLERAEQILENEKQIFEWVEEGQTVQEITAKGGYF